MMDSADKAATESVLSDQRLEIFGAKTLNPDLDFAFDLQIQETITASMLHLPSSSSLSPTPVDPVFVSYDDGFDYMALLLEDIERLDQERRDREAGENLLREMKEDLDRRIFDQKFASEILNIPDDQWQTYGDKYHKPYGIGNEGSSSSASSSLAAQLAWVSSETFKLYFKGLESEERVRDRKVTVAGFGVAICDSRDNLIFDLSKRLDAGGVGMGGGKNTEGLVVEIQALIEGLNAALNFDLKKVTFLCDDFMVYQYVS